MLRESECGEAGGESGRGLGRAAGSGRPFLRGAGDGRRGGKTQQSCADAAFHIAPNPLGLAGMVTALLTSEKLKLSQRGNCPDCVGWVTLPKMLIPE